MNEINETALQEYVAEAKAGNADAFRELYDFLSDQLFSYALSHTKGRDEAMDVVQDAFIELWKALKKFEYKSRGQFFGFVYIILKRRIYKYYKQNLSAQKLDATLIAESYEMEVEDYRYLEKKMLTLPGKYQELLRLRYWSELSFKEIAECLKINEGTAKVWHHRAIKALGGKLEALAL
jgi:RNA polymerase sigma-70 factor (ECF subfamily)